MLIYCVNTVLNEDLRGQSSANILLLLLLLRVCSVYLFLLSYVYCSMSLYDMTILMFLCVYLQSMDQQNTELVYKITSEVSMHCGNNPLVVSTPECNEVCYCGLYQAAEYDTCLVQLFLAFPL